LSISDTDSVKPVKQLIMDRRKFLLNSGLALTATSLLNGCTTRAEEQKPVASSPAFDTWEGVRAQFALSTNRIHMSQMLLASHPKPVQEEIERHRKKFDEDAVTYWENNWLTAEGIVQQAAAEYIDATPEEIALTDSTTMGLAMLYNGLKLKAGDEILTSVHDHYATEKSLEYAAQKNGASIKRMTLYQTPATVSVSEVIDTVKKSIRPATRIIALTWVHSSTGVKLPIRAIANVIGQANQQRKPENRIYFCVDGVHGFGIDNITMKDLGCDFFAAGTHKWIFGPRGTGILFAKKDAWDMIAPTIPAFSFNAYGHWLGLTTDKDLNFGNMVSPGGFHSFEHRWAQNSGFQFQMKIGKSRVDERTHQLSSLLKNGLKEMKHITLHTPLDNQLSAGINCFEVEGISPDDVVKKLNAKNITSSSSPYKVSYVRLTPSIVNNEEEVKTCLKEIENLKA
jgi:selenocysteine lyase/cysteine desulfurase